MAVEEVPVHRPPSPALEPGAKPEFMPPARDFKKGAYLEPSCASRRKACIFIGPCGVGNIHKTAISEPEGERAAHLKSRVNSCCFSGGLLIPSCSQGVLGYLVKIKVFIYVFIHDRSNFFPADLGVFRVFLRSSSTWSVPVLITACGSLAAIACGGPQTKTEH